MLGAPILAGALIDANLWGTGWRLVFLINVPIGALTLLLAIRSLPRGASHPDVKLDVGGVWLVGLALVAIIYPLIQGRTEGWPAWSFALLAAGALLLVRLPALRATPRANPLIEPTLLTNRTYLSGIAVALALFGAFGGLLLCVSLFGQLGEGWSPIHAGLTLTPMVVGMILGMLGSLALVNRLGRHLLHIGILLIAAGAVVARPGPHRCARPPRAGTSSPASSDRRRRRCQHRPALPVHPHQRQHGRGRIRLRCPGSRTTTLDRTRRRRPRHHLLLRPSVTTPRPTRCGITAWACLAPLAAAFVLVFRLPMHAREEADSLEVRSGLVAEGSPMLRAGERPQGRMGAQMRAADRLSERLANGEVVLIDGGMGTELQARGVPMNRAAWSGVANLDNFDVVQQVHEDNIRAGADVIIANSFATSRVMFRPAGSRGPVRGSEPAVGRCGDCSS